MYIIGGRSLLPATKSHGGGVEDGKIFVLNLSKQIQFFPPGWFEAKLEVKIILYFFKTQSCIYC